MAKYPTLTAIDDGLTVSTSKGRWTGAQVALSIGGKTQILDNRAALRLSKWLDKFIVATAVLEEADA